jgi:ribosomal protein S18 acetylase RimI-like enzyme
MVSRLEPWAHGTVLRTPLAPDWWDVNLVRLETTEPGLNAVELLEMVDVLQRGLRHRKLVVEDEATGARLRDGFRKAGWMTERLVAMLRDGAPPAMPPEVVEVPFASTRPLRLEWHADSDWGDDDTQHLISAEAVAARNGDRAFAALDDGTAIGFVAYFSPPGFGAGEIEQAYVTPAARGRGIGSRLISAALAAGGHDANWIVADDEDRPKQLYERLGFRAVWRRHEFTLVPG